MQVKHYYPLNIDFKLLREQKADLIKLQDSKVLDKKVWDSLEGILNIIYDIQREAVDVIGLLEDEVFTLTDE